VLEISEINDLGLAKQVATLLDRECEKLLTRNQELTRELARLTGLDVSQAQLLEVEKLQQQLAQLQRLTFGQSSEKRPQDGNDEAAAAPKPPRKGHGPCKQPELAKREVVHELPADQRHCSQCQGELEPWAEQYESAEEITVVRRRYELVTHKRQKYLCACEDRVIVTAPGPKKLIEGGRYSVEFGVEVALDKFLNHLPLDRQRKMMRREGLRISTSALWDQAEAVSAVLQPTYDALQERILRQPFIHADETRWPFVKKPKAECWQAWAIACEDAVLYRILPSRSAEAGGKLLDGYRGVVMVDGYSAYKTIAARAGPAMGLVNCWAHARRKFVEIEAFYPAECEKILGLIGKLYEVERRVPFRANMSPKAQTDDLARRKVERDVDSRAVIAEMLDWVATLRLTKGSVLRKAVEYMTGRWAGLTRFLDDSRVPLDNNLIERAIRPLALGRKNFLGSRSERGIVVAAVLYSLIETAKLCELDPRKYILEAVQAALEVPHRVLLPHDLRG